MVADDQHKRGQPHSCSWYVRAGAQAAKGTLHYAGMWPAARVLRLIGSKPDTFYEDEIRSVEGSAVDGRLTRAAIVTP